MTTDYADLCERIRQHCQQRDWYGPDFERTYQLEYARRVPHWEPVTELLERFAHAPATIEEITRTEQLIGRELPPALKAIYLLVANGGFGPASGLEDASSLTRVTHGSWQLSDRAANYLEVHPRRHLECDELPDGLVKLCEWDDESGILSMLDLNSGRVYGLGDGIRSDLNTAVLDVDDVDFERTYWMDYQASSVEHWFELWLGGTLERPFSYLEDFEEPPDEPVARSSTYQDEEL